MSVSICATRVKITEKITVLTRGMNTAHAESHDRLLVADQEVS